MPKSYGVLRCTALAAFALMTATVLAATPAKAADPAPTTLAGQKPQAQPAAAKPAPKVRAPKPVKPEKSIEEQRAADGLWMKRSNWLSVRAGYAKATGSYAGGGLVGYGIAYQRMLTPRWAVGGAVQHDALGHLGRAVEISVPFTLEVSRHFNWHTAMRPYLGVGGGYYWHKYYRTGTHYTGRPGAGQYLNFGANMPLNDRHLLGIDSRVSFVETPEGAVNPVFGTEKASQTLWSVKLNWAFAY